ncbi:uncharacterized protein LOC132702429 [Cylas formicarius]|uniref:uncharacterized protein LOC132702429 n=1 Tax=Cylas formicarius TaxID=197179 RepID=UPI0029584E32|nr:uncharacterized protein LOC132702429 [Cylas formicarius]
MGTLVLASLLQASSQSKAWGAYNEPRYKRPRCTTTRSSTTTKEVQKGIKKTAKVETESERRENNGSDCSLHVTHPSVEQYLPVPLSAEPPYTIIIPRKGHIHLRHGQTLNLVCPGEKNRLSLDPTEKIHEPQCENLSILKLNGINQPLSNFKCSIIVKGQVNKQLRPCASGKGTLYDIGHKLPSGQWVGLITVCHDSNSGSTFYTKHQLIGSEIEYASKSTYRPEFSKEGLGIDASYMYLISSQKEAFTITLNSTDLADIYIRQNSFLVKGHLAPHADFLLATSQYSTYFYLNAAPKWQSVNNANWKSLEMAVRKNSRSYGTVDVFTGTHGLLTYPDINNNPQPIYLGGNGVLPVPKHFWKVVRSHRDNSGIAFVVINDPFLKDVPKAEQLLCPDICAAAGWANPNWAKPEKGYLYCCEVSSFREAVSVAPPLEVAGILRAVAL